MDAEGTLDPWNAGGTQGGRRSKERGRDGHGHGTKTLASLCFFLILFFFSEWLNYCDLEKSFYSVQYRILTK